MKKLKLLWLTLLLPSTALAVSYIPYNGQKITSIIVKITNWILGFAGALAILMIIYSGILFITASSNADRQTQAKKTLTNAVFGIIIIVLVYVIISVIENALSVAF